MGRRVQVCIKSIQCIVTTKRFFLHTFLKNSVQRQRQTPMLGCLRLFGAMSEDAVPVAFTADVHLMRRAKERLGTSYAEIVMADVIRAAEHSETLGQAILDAMDDAGDNGKKFNILAIWIEEQDLFAYLFCYESRVHITTVLSFKRVYFVNPYVVFLRVLKCGKTLSGYGESGRFAPSAMRKFKNAMV